MDDLGCMHDNRCLLLSMRCSEINHGILPAQTDENAAKKTMVSATPTPCRHMVATPKNWSESTDLDPSIHGTLEQPAWSGPMAKSYPFTLDAFQSTAIACIVRAIGGCVLV